MLCGFQRSPRALASKAKSGAPSTRCLAVCSEWLHRPLRSASGCGRRCKGHLRGIPRRVDARLTICAQLDKKSSLWRAVDTVSCDLQRVASSPAAERKRVRETAQGPLAREPLQTRCTSDNEHAAQQEERQVARASDTPAPGCTATVAPFRAWRGSRLSVAGAPARTGTDCPPCVTPAQA